VSTSTVSHVLNGTRFVQPETEARVRQAIGQLGYSPNVVARGLRTGNSRTIAVMGVSAVDPLFAEVVRGIEERCYERGYEVFLAYVEYPRLYDELTIAEINSWEEGFLQEMLRGNIHHTSRHGSYKMLARNKESDILTKFVSREVDGMILNAGQPDEILREVLSAVRQPVMLYQRHLEGTPYDSCQSDDYGGTRAALERLLALGHRRIGLLYGFSWESHTVRDRFRAWADVHREAGIPLDTALMRQTLYNLEIADRVTSELLSMSDAPTALVCWSDLLAMAAIDSCRTRNVRVPEDVSVVGFDDLDVSALFWPRLSTIRQAKLEAGHRMADHLLDRIAGKTDGAPARLVTPTTFIERGSAGPRASR